MKVETREVFISDDNQVWFSRNECLRHERQFYFSTLIDKGQVTSLMGVNPEKIVEWLFKNAEYVAQLMEGMELPGHEVVAKQPTAEVVAR